LNWFSSNWFNADVNLISSGLQQECKQESENLDKGRITGSAPPEKMPLPLNGGRSHAFSFLDVGRSAERTVLNMKISHRQCVSLKANEIWWKAKAAKVYAICQ